MLNKAVIWSRDEATLRSNIPMKYYTSTILATGCFDVLHVGHIRMFEAAKEFGGYLIVGINGDERIRALKGPGRPFFTLAERMEVITTLRCVDAVIPFFEDTPAELIRDLRPTYLAKGPEYAEMIAAGTMPEQSAADSVGCKIVPIGPPKTANTNSTLIGEEFRR